MKNKKIFIDFILITCVIFLVTGFFLNRTQAKTDSLKIALTKIIKEDSPQTSHVSIYFYDFKTKKEISLNDTYKYIPASLLKVVFMMAYLKGAENYPELLNEKLTYVEKTKDGYTQTISPIKHIEAGKSYTVNELLTYMIRYSDNHAAELLFQNVDMGVLNHVFTDLGFPQPDLDKELYKVDVKDLAKFFKVLYQGTYLNKEFSQKALDLLKSSEYQEGLVAGIPSSLKIAHKFGERTINNGNATIHQFHECGIVYHPTNPYLLCVMTDGKSIQHQSDLVKKISQVVYLKLQAKLAP